MVQRDQSTTSGYGRALNIPIVLLKKQTTFSGRKRNSLEFSRVLDYAQTQLSAFSSLSGHLTIYRGHLRIL